MLLEGKAAVVTGSSRGLGKAYALALAEAGAQVVVNGTSAPDVAQVVEEVGRRGGRAVACVEGVGTMTGAERLIQSALDAFGHLDILVNNAGIVRDRTLVNMTEEEWDEVIAVHLKGTFACGKFAAIQMRAQKSGRIINTTAHGGLQGGFGRSNYAAAKAGILALTFTWALELGRYNITVNAIRPEARTRMTEPLIERAREAAVSGVPDPYAGRRWPEPEEEAPLVVFLASDQAGWLNGQVIDIDGPRVSVWSRPEIVKSLFMPQGWTPELLAQHLTPDFVKGAGG